MPVLLHNLLLGKRGRAASTKIDVQQTMQQAKPLKYGHLILEWNNESDVQQALQQKTCSKPCSKISPLFSCGEFFPLGGLVVRDPSCARVLGFSSVFGKSLAGDEALGLPPSRGVAISPFFCPAAMSSPAAAGTNASAWDRV